MFCDVADKTHISQSWHMEHDCCLDRDHTQRDLCGEHTCRHLRDVHPPQVRTMPCQPKEDFSVARCAWAENKCLLFFTMCIPNTSDRRSVCFFDIPFLLMIGSEHQCPQSRVEGDFTAVRLQNFGNVEDDNNRVRQFQNLPNDFGEMFVRSYCSFFWRGDNSLCG